MRPGTKVLPAMGRLHSDVDLLCTSMTTWALRDVGQTQSARLIVPTELPDLQTCQLQPFATLDLVALGPPALWNVLATSAGLDDVPGLAGQVHDRACQTNPSLVLRITGTA